MPDKQIIDSFISLKEYCESQSFKGWDPYDGLNSRVFQTLPFFKKSAFFRLAFIQAFKRNPVNLRKILFVPKEYNSKGIGLLLNGYCNLYHYIKNSSDEISISKNDCIEKINYLAELLISLQNKDYSGACWGYNFDWQARRLFLFPKGTPTVVATTFCATALMEAFEVTGNNKYLETALSSASFVISDLHRTECNGGFLFSYSPLNGNDTVYNASLLGSKLLSRCYYYEKNEEYINLAKKSIIACCNAQNEDGSWVYGMLPVQSWIDSFHTGYNLDSLIHYREATADNSFDRYINKGFDYYINNFFKSDGTPKYYNNKTYPIDIHCPGQLFVTLYNKNWFKENKIMAKNVMLWTIRNMQDKKGYFYYQIKEKFSSKISYMRWSNAFMFNAMTYYLLADGNNE